MVKTILEHKQRPLDVVNLAMLQLSIYYCNEIKLGFANRGNLKLDPVYSKYRMEAQYILTRKVTNPEDIIKDLREHPESFMKTSGCVETLVYVSEESSASSASSASDDEIETEKKNIIDDDDPTVTDDINAGGDQTDDDFGEEEVQIFKLSISSSQPTAAIAISASQDQISSSQPLRIYTHHDAKVVRALDFIKNNNVSFDENLKRYHVVDEMLGSAVYMVNYSKQPYSCSCTENFLIFWLLNIGTVNSLFIAGVLLYLN